MVTKRTVLLVVNSGLIRAGVPNVTMTLVRQLSPRFTFDVITYGEEEGPYDAEFTALGGRIFRLPLLDYDRHKLTYPLRYFQIRRCVKRLLKENRYDAIHCHNGLEAGVFLRYARAVPVRIAHAHGTYRRQGSNKLLLWYRTHCKRLIARYATVRLACSTQAGDSLFADRPFANVLNPVDASAYKGLQKPPHDGCHLLQIGYYCANKNQLFSLRLLKALVEDGVDATLTLIGFAQDERYYAQMTDTIRELGLQDRVRLLPSDADKAAAFADADAVLLPSFTEGLPLVALEAQAAQTAVVMSHHVSTDADLGLGVYAAYDDVAAWKETVKGLCNGRQTAPVDTSGIETAAWCDRIGAYYEQ